MFWGTCMDPGIHRDGRCLLGLGFTGGGGGGL